MLAGLSLGILLHVNLTGLTVDALDLNVGAKVGLLHLEFYQTAGHGDRAYVMSGIGFHSHDITFLKGDIVGVDEESLAGVLELYLNIFALIGPGHTCQVVK